MPVWLWTLLLVLFVYAAILGPVIYLIYKWSQE